MTSHFPSLLIQGPAVAMSLWRSWRTAFEQARQRWRRQQDAARTARALQHLDERTLRDLGLHRSEIPSLAAALDGSARATRRLARITLNRGYFGRHA